VAAIASKIRKRVSSASAFEIFSIRLVFMIDAQCIGITRPHPRTFFPFPACLADRKLMQPNVSMII